MHANLTSPATRWFDLRYRVEELADDKAAAMWLRQAAEKVYNALQDSNFNREISQAYYDLVLFGTASITQEAKQESDKGWGGMLFSAVPLKEAFFEEDHEGQAEYYYRLLKWTPVQIMSKFGTDVPKSVISAAEKAPETKLEVLFAIFPRKGKEPAEMGKKLAPKRRPIGYKYILKESAEDLGKEGGYYEMPAFMPRWEVTSDSMWGNSPSMDALNDILTLNAMVEIRTIADEKQLDPPILVEERAMVTDLNLDARAVTVVRNIDGVREWTLGGNISVTQEAIGDLQDSIKQTYRVNELLLPPPQAQPMTAYESGLRYQEMQRILGPTLGMLQNDMLDKIVARTFNLMMRAGELGDIPESVLQARSELEVEYVGQAARAERVAQAQNVEQFVGKIAELSQVMPEMLDTVDSVKVANKLARYYNVDPELLRSDSEVNEIKANRQQQAAAAAEAEQMQARGDAAQSSLAAVSQLQDASERQAGGQQ